ncbi:hypothetical protein IEO21_09883 [Rhodonia placenta]|uniref:Uncharacterized protein n=1 Tax=Rhodonia placenta TaxID=104341 RepID=A0A8H7NTH7_9APHY|nr:hypothetical protein IEO21_09883 [Postia placenta]
MSVLWETMSGLAPLIRTLPRNYVCNYENVDDKPKDHMRTFVVGVDRSPLDSNDRLALNTQRLDHYARFIKHVTIHNEDAYYATLHDLSIHTPSDYRLLPEVRTLDIHLDAVNGPEGVDMLLGPRLDAISVRITGMDAGLRWTMVLFSQMFAVCRGLRTLKADLGDCHAQMMCVVLDALRAARPPLTTLHLGVQNRIYAYGFSDSCMTTPNESMERLLRAVSGTVRDFSTTIMISPSILPSFSLFRNLQNLVVYVRPPEPSYRSTRLSLPSLCSLEIIADHIFWETPPWLRWLEAEHLHTLAIFSREHLDDTCGKRLRDFNVSLLMCSFRKTLQVVSIHTRELSYKGWRPPYNAMRPLLALPKLSALYLPRRWVAEGVLETLAEDRPGIQLLEHCPIHPRAFPDIPDVPLSRSELWSIP